MRVLMEPDTGEMVEVIPEMIHDLTPYGYREAKAAHMRASIERREVEREYDEAIREHAAAERAYRAVLSQEMLSAKADHGATMAEAVAKGTEKVGEAKERVIIAEGMVYSKRNRLQTCSEDRQGVVQLTAWSRSIDPSTFPHEGGA